MKHLYTREMKVIKVVKGTVTWAAQNITSLKPLIWKTPLGRQAKVISRIHDNMAVHTLEE